MDRGMARNPTLKLSLDGSADKGFSWAFYRNGRLIGKSDRHKTRAAMRTSLVAFLKDVQADWFEVYDYAQRKPKTPKRRRKPR